MRSPLCYNCRVRKARPRSCFCTQKCAVEYAEEVMWGERYCKKCGDWHNHCRHATFSTWDADTIPASARYPDD